MKDIIMSCPYIYVIFALPMSTNYYWLLLCASRKSNKQLWNNKIKQIPIYLFWSLLYCPFGHQQKENERFLNREGLSESSKAVIKGRPPKIWFTVFPFLVQNISHWDTIQHQEIHSDICKVHTERLPGSAGTRTEDLLAVRQWNPLLYSAAWVYEELQAWSAFLPILPPSSG